jgi:hypothetical protein
MAQPSRSGAAVSGHTIADPAAVLRNASATEIQNRYEPRSSTHPALSARPASAIQDRSSTVFPLPGGADTSVTRAASRSRSNSAGRDTIARVMAGSRRLPSP